MHRSPGTSIELAQALIGLFTSGDYSPGDRLPGERSLAEALNVGRSTMREALKALAVLGIVEVRQGDGTYLRRTTSDLIPHMVEWGIVLGDRSLESMAEARQYVEVSLAGLAAIRRTPAEMDAIQQAFDVMSHAAEHEDIPTYVRGDLDFHLAIAGGADSEVLAGILRSIGGLMTVWTQKVLGQITLTESLEVHRPILDAMRAQDPVAGRHAMDNHMRQAIKYFQSLAVD
ncbi:hypothetical protein ADJ73_00985 [Arsenicicoccus sp. oral taxon 190]|nr:hypothetical protein ADJ73_00985 [Arsenicicoccus sp. oral taxon 190]